MRSIKGSAGGSIISPVLTAGDLARNNSGAVLGVGLTCLPVCRVSVVSHSGRQADRNAWVKSGEKWRNIKHRV